MSSSCPERALTLEVHEETAYGVYLTDLGVFSYKDKVEKSSDGYPLVRLGGRPLAIAECH